MSKVIVSYQKILGVHTLMKEAVLLLNKVHLLDLIIN